MNNKFKVSYKIVIIAFVVAFFIGIMLAPALIPNAMNKETNVPGDGHSTHDHSMNHEMVEADSNNPPSVKINVEKDPKSGWNLRIDTENFQFTPENVNSNSLTDEGHAHLFIDGDKITRLYSNWYYIGDLEKGEHEIRVMLNSNEHKVLAINGSMIMDSVKIIQK